MANLVTYNELKEATGYSQPVDVVTWLKRQRIPYLTGKHGRPITTRDALNQALGVNTEDVEPDFKLY